MISKVNSAACLGISVYKVQIEVDVANGLPQLIVVGLPDTAVKESRERVRSAIKNSGLRFPPEKITINLAPADIKKEGPAFDLPIAVGILAAAEMIPSASLSNYIFLGELALDGSVRPFRGALAIVSSLKDCASFIVPYENAGEAALEQDAVIYGVNHLREVIQMLRGELEIPPYRTSSEFFERKSLPFESVDFSEVKGQPFAKRALEIAVAGGHNLLMIGPPGSGKTMLARRIPTILPPLELKEAIEITKIYSVAGLSERNSPIVRQRPFRTPHHSISNIALVGGGSWPRPGEISLSHGGVLFLDEFPEFHRDALEALRGPLEDGEIIISRVKMQLGYPSRFMLVAAMNPCPCGFLSDPRKSCRCSLGQIQKYQSKISGPILDRIDLHIEVPPLPLASLESESAAESSQSIRSRIVRCREIQNERFQGRPFLLNAQMRPRDIKEFGKPDLEGKKLLEMVMKELRFSARAYYKVLKISRTIADLAECENIQAEHIAEAIQYRSLDRQW